MNHPQFNEALRWIADGGTIQTLDKHRKSWHSNETRGILVQLANDVVPHDSRLRLKPIMVQLGDRTFPLPLQEEPKPGTVVHLARPGLSPSTLNWTATEGMYAALNQGLLHLDEDSAAQHVAALLEANMQAVSKATAKPKGK